MLLHVINVLLESFWATVKAHEEVLVTLLLAIISGVYWLITHPPGFLKRIDLHPFFSTKEVSKASRFYIETRCQEVQSLDGQGVEIKESTALIPYFIDKAFRRDDDDQRFYLILAESGMGKTTFLINLYVRYSRKVAGSKFNIELFTLWHPKTWDKLINYPEAEAKNTCLLLDALDEDPKALTDIATRLNEIIDKVWMFRKVVICANPQLFTSEEGQTKINIPYGSNTVGYHSFLKIHLAQFSKKDIGSYITRKYGLLRMHRWRAALDLIKMSSKLMERPLLLNFVDDLVEGGKHYTYSYEVYDALVNKWISRDSFHVNFEGSREEFKDQMMSFLKHFALKVFTIRQSAGFYLNEDEVKLLMESGNYRFDLAVFKSQSIITRDASRFFKFSHFDLFEFFLALAAIDPRLSIGEKDLTEFPYAKLFYQELYWHKEVLPFFAKSGGRVYTKQGNEEIEISKILQSSNLEKVNNLFISGMKDLSLMLLSPLKNMVTLQAIDTPIMSYESITNLRKLQTLNFENCNIQDVKPLKFLPELYSLHLRNGKIREIDALATLSDLHYLNLQNNQVEDVSPLRSLSKLKRLSLANNRISSVEPLKELKELSWLFIAGNPLSKEQIDDLKVAIPGCTVDDVKMDTHI